MSLLSLIARHKYFLLYRLIMARTCRRRLVLNLLTIQLLFLILFIVALVQYARMQPLLYTGLSYAAENFIVMGICVLSEINVIYELSRVR